MVETSMSYVKLWSQEIKQRVHVVCGRQYCFIKIKFYVTKVMLAQWIHCSSYTRAHAVDIVLLFNRPQHVTCILDYPLACAE